MSFLIHDHDMHEMEKERRLMRCPICDRCDEPIQDDYKYVIYGEQMCERCFREYVWNNVMVAIEE